VQTGCNSWQIMPVIRTILGKLFDYYKSEALLKIRIQEQVAEANSPSNLLKYRLQQKE
jgi:hypothetical protein